MTAMPQTDAEASAELALLAAQIADHNRRYHTEDAPTVSDAEFDALVRRAGSGEAAAGKQPRVMTGYKNRWKVLALMF